jgi:hypothetical protein
VGTCERKTDIEKQREDKTLPSQTKQEKASKRQREVKGDKEERRYFRSIENER